MLENDAFEAPTQTMNDATVQALHEVGVALMATYGILMVVGVIFVFAPLFSRRHDRW